MWEQAGGHVIYLSISGPTSILSPLLLPQRLEIDRFQGFEEKKPKKSHLQCHAGRAPWESLQSIVRSTGAVRQIGTAHRHIGCKVCIRGCTIRPFNSTTARYSSSGYDQRWRRGSPRGEWRGIVRYAVAVWWCGVCVCCVCAMTCMRRARRKSDEKEGKKSVFAFLPGVLRFTGDKRARWQM